MAPLNAVLVTGAAGFIGHHVSRALLQQGRTVVGIDNLNSYYSPALKEARLNALKQFPNFHFTKLDIADRSAMEALFREGRFSRVVHLAAQAGVRYSLIDPAAYVNSNLIGFINVLEGCRNHNCEHLLYASSSSVYGGNSKVPFSTADSVNHPLALYGASKKANELMAHAYSHPFGLPTTGLRFFTVYGPWGRPDMAMWLFTEAILAEKPITLFNSGQMRRDFTYIDDVVESVVRLLDRIPKGNPDWRADKPDPASSSAPWRIFNIGGNRPEALMDVVSLLERTIGKQAKKEFAPMQIGDVAETWADTSDLEHEIGYKPATSLKEGIPNFVEWYKQFHGL